MPGTGLDATRAFFPTVNVGGSMTFNSTGNIVDGVINNFAEDGEPRQNLPQDAVQEFKVSNVQYKAEFGGRVSNSLSANFGKIQTARDGTQGELAIRLFW